MRAEHPPRTITYRCLFASVIALAFLVRLWVANDWHSKAETDSQHFRLGDSHSYWTLGGEIARGRPYQYGSPNASIFRAPLYPLFLSPWTLVTPESEGIWRARLMGCALGTLAVWLLMLLAGQLHPSPTPLLAGLLAALYPGAVGMSVVILSEAVFCPLMIVHLICWCQAWKSESFFARLSFGLAGGLAAGAAVLARPSWLLFTPFLGACGILLGGKKPASRWRHLQIMISTVIGLSICMMPWWIRNAQQTGRFVLTTLQVGPSLYDGLHAGATGGSDEGMQFMRQFAAEQRLSDANSTSELDGTFEYRLNIRAQQAALLWASQNPGEVLRLAIAKFSKTWTLWPDGGEIGSVSIRVGLTLGCFGILTLALIASKRAITDSGWLALLCWMPCIYFTLLHMVFVGSIRYREPALLVLCALAAVTLDRMVEFIGVCKNCIPTDAKRGISSEPKPSLNRFSSQ
ncbi:MAG: glycosyltransferase family 39 protein [Planctomycetales bacterium]|nr:glycosyltransferase family 39 protein [Planctomycetales bacterium]